jgi:hypothetical protein
MDQASYTYCTPWGWALHFATTSRAPTTSGQARWATYIAHHVTSSGEDKAPPGHYKEHTSRSILDRISTVHMSMITVYFKDHVYLLASVASTDKHYWQAQAYDFSCGN